jgi:hypothetical protein
MQYRCLKVPEVHIITLHSALVLLLRILDKTFINSILMDFTKKIIDSFLLVDLYESIL